jgi:ATP-dependent RNA helicase DDX18/HAS1
VHAVPARSQRPRSQIRVQFISQERLGGHVVRKIKTFAVAKAGATSSRRPPAQKQDFYARESWEQVGANSEMTSALRALGITRPSHVQAEALMVLLSGSIPPELTRSRALKLPLHALIQVVQAWDERCLYCSGQERVVVADQAGSGKTLAYLVPLIQQFKQAEAAAGGKQTQPRMPSAVIMCPTEELCAQVLLTCRALAKVCADL